MTNDGLEGGVGPSGVERVGYGEAAHHGGTPAGRLGEGHADVPGRQTQKSNKKEHTKSTEMEHPDKTTSTQIKYR